MGKHELRPASPLNLSIYVGGGRETHKDSFSNGECIRTGSVWKSGHLVLNCEIEIYYQLRCSNKPLEKSIDKGDNPVSDLECEQRLPTSTAEESSGLRDYKLKKPLQKPMKKVSSVRMPVELAMISMSMLTVELVPIFVEKNLPLLNLLRASQVDQDLSLHSQPM